jgi:hypothetical protein
VTGPLDVADVERATESTPAASPDAVVAQFKENSLGALEQIISDGRAGAGESARRSAEAAGLETAGELSVIANVSNSDLTLWFGDDMSTISAQAVLEACEQVGRPLVRVVSRITRPQDVARRLDSDGINHLHVAGENVSRSPRFGEQVGCFLPRCSARSRHSVPDPFPKLAALTIARIPARSASGSDDQTSMMARKPGSTGGSGEGRQSLYGDT